MGAWHTYHLLLLPHFWVVEGSRAVVEWSCLGLEGCRSALSDVEGFQGLVAVVREVYWGCSRLWRAVKGCQGLSEGC